MESRVILLVNSLSLTHYQLWLFKTEQIQKKNCKSNQSKLKSQKSVFGSNVFRSFFTQPHSLFWFAVLILPTELN